MIIVSPSRFQLVERRKVERSRVPNRNTKMVMVVIRNKEPAPMLVTNGTRLWMEILAIKLRTTKMSVGMTCK